MSSFLSIIFTKVETIRQLCPIQGYHRTNRPSSTGKIALDQTFLVRLAQLLLQSNGKPQKALDMSVTIDHVSLTDGEDPHLFFLVVDRVDDPILAEPDFPKKIRCSFKRFPYQLRSTREPMINCAYNGVHYGGRYSGQIFLNLRVPDNLENRQAYVSLPRRLLFHFRRSSEEMASSR